MVLTLTPECSTCHGTGFYREPDPAGRGQLENCPNCNPAKPSKVYVNPELTAARARIAKLEAALQKIAKQKTTDEMSHADGRLGDFEGAYDTLIERAREALTP